ncbi:hypothetical protein SAMN05661096_03770 [Marivirga sericea]|uniref:Uncharacterized protein n=1 Tax=Marivirga sericea TaxID=1028 RepID=A0A1X7LAQ0_9BACT|nr:hypothetical protein SAMN05661096_03770 [Marivirga sericea]
MFSGLLLADATSIMLAIPIYQVATGFRASVDKSKIDQFQPMGPAVCTLRTSGTISKKYRFKIMEIF